MRHFKAFRCPGCGAVALLDVWFKLDIDRDRMGGISNNQLPRDEFPCPYCVSKFSGEIMLETRLNLGPGDLIGEKK